MTLKPLNIFQRAFRFTGLERNTAPVFGCLFFGFVFGSILDRSDTNSMIFYRDRSALYGRELQKDEEPSWPTKWNFFT